MVTKSVSSTQAQNNFGQVLDDVTHNRTRYVVERRGVPQAILLSVEDFANILNDDTKRQQVVAILREVRPEYQLGRVLYSSEVAK